MTKKQALWMQKNLSEIDVKTMKRPLPAAIKTKLSQILARCGSQKIPKALNEFHKKTKKVFSQFDPPPKKNNKQIRLRKKIYKENPYLATIVATVSISASSLAVVIILFSS